MVSRWINVFLPPNDSTNVPVTFIWAAWHIGGNDFLYNFNNMREGVSYEVQLSTDLDTWTDPAFAVVTSSSTMPVTIPGSQAANGKLFVRLKVSE